MGVVRTLRLQSEYSTRQPSFEVEGLITEDGGTYSVFRMLSTLAMTASTLIAPGKPIPICSCILDAVVGWIGILDRTVHNSNDAPPVLLNVATRPSLGAR